MKPKKELVRVVRAPVKEDENGVYDAMYQELCTDVKGKAGEAQK